MTMIAVDTTIFLCQFDSADVLTVSRLKSGRNAIHIGGHVTIHGSSTQLTLLAHAILRLVGGES